jgi:hypothetical protein
MGVQQLSCLRRFWFVLRGPFPGIVVQLLIVIAREGILADSSFMRGICCLLEYAVLAFSILELVYIVAMEQSV